MAELEKWAEGLYQPAPQTTLAQLGVQTYWVRALKSLVPVPELDGLLGVDKAQGFLFCGRTGSGRQTAAMALAASMADYDYRFLRLIGSEASGDTEGKLRALFSQLGEDQPVVMLCEDLEECDHSAELAAGLGQLVRACREYGFPVILIVIAAEPEDVPQSLRRELQVCRFSDPDLLDRTSFYESRLGSGFPLEKGLRIRDLAAVAEGLSLGQLQQSLQLIKLFLKEAAALKFKNRYSLAVTAIRNKELCLDMAMFREIVNHLKTPQKETVAPVQLLQSVAAVPATEPEKPEKPAPESKTDLLRKSKNASDFFSNL